MPVVALPFKALGASLAASWNSIRNYSRARLLNRSSSAGIDEYNMTDSPSYKKEMDHQLPQMVKGDGAITGLRSFMRRAYRSTAATSTQKTAPLTIMEEMTFATHDLVDYSYYYHDQLKTIHSIEAGGQDFHPGSRPVPQPPAPAALHQDTLRQQNQLRYQQWASTMSSA